MCRLESRFGLQALGGTQRGCVRVQRYLDAPGRPKDPWRERFRGGYRITGTRGRFIPEDRQLDGSVLAPAYWRFNIFFAFRDGTHECLVTGVLKEGTAFRFESFPLSNPC